jgi:flagellar biosynthesis regulator FlaF
MPPTNYALQAYRVASGYKSQKDIEADVFREVTDGLRAARTGGRLQRVKAFADDRRLWMAVQGVISDPANILPAELRAQLVSLSLAIQRAVNTEEPDLEFLISINEAILAGLAS